VAADHILRTSVHLDITSNNRYLQRESEDAVIRKQLPFIAQSYHTLWYGTLWQLRL